MILLVLKAINEDSPTVPTLLTDYILKGKFFFKIIIKSIFIKCFQENKLSFYLCFIFYVELLPIFILKLLNILCRTPKKYFEVIYQVIIEIFWVSNSSILLFTNE